MCCKELSSCETNSLSIHLPRKCVLNFLNTSPIHSRNFFRWTSNHPEKVLGAQRLRLVLRIRRLGRGTAQCPGAGRAPPENYLSQAGQEGQNLLVCQPGIHALPVHIPLCVFLNGQLWNIWWWAIRGLLNVICGFDITGSSEQLRHRSHAECCFIVAYFDCISVAF